MGLKLITLRQRATYPPTEPARHPTEVAIFLKIFILFVRDSTHKQGNRKARGEAGYPLRKEPNGRLDPRTTLGS